MIKDLELYNKRKPFGFSSLFPSIFEEHGDLFSFFDKDFFNRDSARMNVKEDENNFYINIDIPGISKENVKVEIRDNVLFVDAEEKAKDSHRKLTKRLTLPEDIDHEKSKADLKDGLLSVTIPRTKHIESKTVLELK